MLKKILDILDAIQLIYAVFLMLLLYFIMTRGHVELHFFVHIMIGLILIIDVMNLNIKKLYTFMIIILNLSIAILWYFMYLIPSGRGYSVNGNDLLLRINFLVAAIMMIKLFFKQIIISRKSRPPLVETAP